MRTRILASIVLGVAIINSIAFGRIINVPGNAPTIQDGINIAGNSGDIVLVAPGIYTGPKNRDIVFNGKIIEVRSMGGPANCVIDCENQGRGFIFWSRETRASIVNGFTIRNGLGDDNGGGGILCIESGPTIANCVIRNCRSEFGGGIGYQSFFDATIGPLITDCEIGWNETIRNGGGDSMGAGGGISCYGNNVIIINCFIHNNIAGKGAGIDCLGSDAQILNCDVYENNAILGGGFDDGAGGGIYASDCSLNIEKCRIYRNTTAMNGGGIAFNTGNPTIVDCNIYLNQAELGGGGISEVDATTRVDRCTISDNVSILGGGIFSQGSTGEVFNCTVWHNEACDKGGGIYCDRSSPTITNCTIAQNGMFVVDQCENPCYGAGIACVNESAPQISYCNINSNQPDLGDNILYGLGGGVFCDNSSPRLFLCKIMYNLAEVGGGICVEDAKSQPIIEQCEIAYNKTGRPFDLNDQSGGGLAFLRSGGQVLACAIHDNYGRLRGGGLYLMDANTEISGCQIFNNMGNWSGGGIQVDGDLPNGDGPIISFCNIISNTTLVRGGGIDYSYLTNNAIHLKGCMITDNRAGYSGGGIECTFSGGEISNCSILRNQSEEYGGGISVDYDFDHYVPNANITPIVRNCTISDNVAAKSGGGLCGRATTVENCIIQNNKALGPQNGEGRGGGVLCAFSSRVRNCLISGNKANAVGGGIDADNSTIENCTIASNVAVSAGGGIFSDGQVGPYVLNSIIYFNRAAQNENWGIGKPLFDYCCTAPIQNLLGKNNIISNPMFMDPANGNYKLLLGSPCIDSGMNQPWMNNAFDLAGAPRILDGIVDRGAYEFIRTHEQDAPQVVSDGAGGAIYVWEQQGINGEWDIYAQRVDVQGHLVWGNGYPLAICTESGDQRYPQVVAYDDNNGQLNGAPGSKGAIIVWTDFRNKTIGSQYAWYRFENSDIYAQKVRVDGTLAWNKAGVAVCAADAKDYNPQIIAPAWDGSVVIAWLEKFGAYAIPLCNPETDYTYSSTTLGSATPLPGCGATKYRILAQRLDSSGQALMTPNGVSCTSLGGIKDDVHLVSDENRGAIITWVQAIPMNSANYDIYAQRIENNGFLRWGVLGIPVCAATGLQLHPRIAKDGMGGAIMTWQDNRSGNGDIYANRVDANGNRVANWPVNGLAVCTVAGYQVLPEIAGNGLGAATIVWQDLRNNKDFNIYAQRVNPTGTIKWGLTGNPVTTAVGAQLTPQITGDGASGVYVTWMDGRYGRFDIYAQWLDTNGGAYWGENGDYPPNTPGIKEYNGAAICRADGNQIDPQAFWSPWGSYYVVWTDRRKGDAMDADIYAQQADFHGKVKWGSALRDKNGKLIAQ